MMVMVQWFPERTHVGDSTKVSDSPSRPVYYHRLHSTQHVSAKVITMIDFPQTKGRSDAGSKLFGWMFKVEQSAINATVSDIHVQSLKAVDQKNDHACLTVAGHLRLLRTHILCFCCTAFVS